MRKEKLIELYQYLGLLNDVKDVSPDAELELRLDYVLKDWPKNTKPEILHYGHAQTTIKIHG